jgi:hypothetical protein
MMEGSGGRREALSSFYDLLKHDVNKASECLYRRGSPLPEKEKAIEHAAAFCTEFSLSDTLHLCPPPFPAPQRIESLLVGHLGILLKQQLEQQRIIPDELDFGSG